MSQRALPPDDISPHEFFTSWAPNAVRTDPERTKRLDGMYARIQFLISGADGGPFHLHIANGEIWGAAGHIEAPDVTLAVDVETWRQLNAGAIKAPEAVMAGKLKFKGNMYLALKIHFIIS